MAANALLGAALQTGSGSTLGTSSAGGSGDVLFGDTHFGSGPVVNLGGGSGLNLSPVAMGLIGGGALLALWMLRR